MRDLIRSLLTPNPDDRPSIWELEITLTQFDSIPTIALGKDALKIKHRQEAGIKKDTKKRPSFSDSEEEESWEAEWKPEEKVYE